jgi:regulatory protein
LVGSRRARSSGARVSDRGGSAGRDGGAEGPRGTAKDRALRLLGVRWRSRAELQTRLARIGFDGDEIERALADLERVGLVDDERFAREVVKDQVGRRMAGDRAIRAALREKGVAQEAVELALGESADAGEDARALALAERQAVRLQAVPIEAAHRRIVGLLLRRGYPSTLAREVTGRALAGRFDSPDGSC